MLELIVRVGSRIQGQTLSYSYHMNAHSLRITYRLMLTVTFHTQITTLQVLVD